MTVTNGRASSAALDGLHAAIADVLSAQLKGDNVDTKLLAVAIKFLKDNGIDAPATSPRFSGIVDELNRLNVDDDPAHLTN
jgi:hypothetical protein